MKTNLMPKLSGPELVEFLELNNDGVEVGQYFRKFTPEELNSARELFADESITFSQASEDVKSQIKSLKDTLKEQSEMLKKLLDQISMQGTNENGKTYLFKDFTERMVYKYDQAGQLVGSRKMLPSERQISLQVHE